MEYDIIAIGDTTTDAFIKLKEASVIPSAETGNSQICMPFGEKIPFEDCLIVAGVGNSANAAVSASRLGLRSALVSNVGSDLHGKESIAALSAENVGVEFIDIEQNKPSNYHFVLLFNGERTILVKHEEFDYTLPDIGKPKWIYLSSLRMNTLAFHQTIAQYLENNPEVKLAFQPGTFQIEMGLESLGAIYRRSEILFLNVEEAKKVLGANPATQDKREEVKELLVLLKNAGPKNVVITDGPSGAYAHDGTDFWFIPPYPDPKPPLDRTGAGDSFASAVVSAVALDLPLSSALEWGPVNSMSVVQYIGARAGLLTRNEIDKYLTDRPAEYKVEKI